MRRIGIMQGRLVPFSLNVLQCFPTNTWEEELALSLDLGFDCIELLYDKELRLKELLGAPQQAAKLKRPEATSVCLDYFTPRELNDRTIQELETAIEFCNGIGVLVLPLFATKSPVEVHQFLAQVHDRGILERCKTSSQTIAIETDLTAAEQLEICEVIGYSNLKVCYDLGNAAFNGFDVCGDIELLGDRLGHVHIKDKNRDGQNVLLGTGIVDFGDVDSALKNINYIGTCVLETAYFSDPVAEATRNLNYIREAWQLV